MTGFGIYETLRLVIPGSIAVAILTLVLRLATGQGPLLAGGPFSSVVEGLQGATFLFAALSAGFILYLVDLPTRARIFAGDPENGIRLPTDVLREILQGTAHHDKSFSLYFILSDGRLPPELHRRIYFFGGLYRIYFDARVLAATGVALGVPLSLAVAGGAVGDWIHLEFWLPALGLILAAVVMVLVGESRHAVESMRKHAPRGTRYPAEGLLGSYLGRAGKACFAMVPAAAIVGALGVLGNFLADTDELFARSLGFLLATIALILWIMVEMGPPASITHGDRTVPSGPVRGRILMWMRLSPSTRTQYTQLQRGIMDLSLLAPAIVAAAGAAQTLDRNPAWVLAWGVLVIPCVLIMAIRKHEQRLLNSYQDQVRWLQINESNIKKLANEGPGDEWY